MIQMHVEYVQVMAFHLSIKMKMVMALMIKAVAVLNLLHLVVIIPVDQH